MVTLLAYAPEERWTFVRDGDRIVLMRPPFQEDITASDAEVERAVTVHGWIALERDFATRQELVDFIGNESVRVWSDRPTRSIESLRDALLARLTVADLDQQIERVGMSIDHSLKWADNTWSACDGQRSGGYPSQDPERMVARWREGQEQADRFRERVVEELRKVAPSPSSPSTRPA